MANEIAIDCSNLTKIYGDGHCALNDLCVRLCFGEVHGLVGPNGAGKSTFIHLLAGILRPSSGSISRSVASAADLAWVSQKTAVDWYLNVEDNVLLGARLGGCYGKQARARVSQALTVAGLSSKAKRQLDSLSGGEQQRTQIARALAQNARILLLDEPTTGLDPGAAHKLMTHLKQLADDGCCILVSSHDLGLVDQFASDILVLQEGELQAQPKRSQNVRVHYEGDVPDSICESLQKAGVTCIMGNPIEIEIACKTTFSTAIQILLKSVNITHIESSHSLNTIFQHAIT